jgi:glycosyltransferase involved in cell wall biosynthesis
VRIAIDGGTWGNQRGYGRYTREVVTALARRRRHDYVLVLDQGTLAQAQEPTAGGIAIPEGLSIHSVSLGGAPSDAASAGGFRTPRDMWRMGRALARCKADVIYFPSVYTFVPVPSRTPIAVTIHDVIAERFPSLIFATPRARLFWNAKLRLARWQAERILTVSAHAARGIHDVFGVPTERVGVTGEAPAAVFAPVADRARVQAVRQACCGAGASDAVMAYVGGVSPHKNLPALVRVFVRLLSERREQPLHLVIVGDYEQDVFLSSYPAVRDLVEREGRGRVRFTGRLPDVDLAALLSGVHAVVLPSFDEGFGLPAIEAAACGAPVIATQSSAIPEVLGAAALYFDPAVDDTLHAALVRVLDDAALRTTLATRGCERARVLSWRDVAARIEVLLEACATRGSRP